MAISVNSIGTGGAVALTVSASVGGGGVPAASLIVVCVQDTTVGAATGTVTDSAGNTYTLIASRSPNNSTTNGAAQMFYAWNSSALSSGNSITYTGTDAARAKAISSFYATGIDASSDPLDTGVTNVASAATAAPTITSGAPAVAGELFVAFCGRNNPNASFTQDTARGWVTPPVAATIGSGSPNAAVNGGSQVNAGTSALTWSPTFNTGANTGTIIAGFKPASAGTSYTLTADGGSFTLTGQSAGLKASRKLAASAGAFTLTGQAAGLKASRRLFGDTATFALAGQAAALKASRKLTAGTGSFTLTGNAAVLSRVIRLVADAGSFAFTGIAAGLKASRKLVAEAGAFVLAGNDAGLVYTPVGGTVYTLQCDAGHVSVSGIDARLILIPAGVVQVHVPHRSGARFSDGTRYRQYAKSRFYHTDLHGNGWVGVPVDGDPWTPIDDNSGGWTPIPGA